MEPTYKQIAEWLVDAANLETNPIFKKRWLDRAAQVEAMVESNDTVPRLVFNASVQAIANKDAFIKELVEALELTLATAQQFEKQASKGVGGRRGGFVFEKARRALAKYKTPSE